MMKIAATMLMLMLMRISRVILKLRKFKNSSTLKTDKILNLIIVSLIIKVKNVQRDREF